MGCQIASPDANSIASNKDKPGDINILAVMVPGGAYAEDRETRLRSRYAITAALLAQGYAPEDADHIGQCLLDEGAYDIVKLKLLVSEIENFKEGIFKPLLHHPMILSLLMPFSSVGGVYLIEYLL
ncbi:MAG: hypothetical protein LZF85_09245 [Nitrosomonas sp.]|uniref:hypothetical protein n=1 Tax=Nitrosomonas sp. TaxID=42353 RepID=UPI0025DD2BC4|nr:hypothetical protein [Nitrosomonas sp.]UJP01969.1 MAG: hypothetical protein LZF85_09245 [Nitrosomonas sp.]